MKTLENGRIYVEIGETFTAEDGTMLRCEESDYCAGCYFRRVSEAGVWGCRKPGVSRLLCGDELREDGNCVIFVHA